MVRHIDKQIDGFNVSQADKIIRSIKIEPPDTQRHQTSDDTLTICSKIFSG